MPDEDIMAHKMASVLDEKLQYLEGLGGERLLRAVGPQFPGGQVQLELAETHPLRAPRRSNHPVAPRVGEILARWAECQCHDTSQAE